MTVNWHQIKRNFRNSNSWPQKLIKQKMIMFKVFWFQEIFKTGLYGHRIYLITGNASSFWQVGHLSRLGLRMLSSLYRHCVQILCWQYPLTISSRGHRHIIQLNLKKKRYFHRGRPKLSSDKTIDLITDCSDTVLNLASFSAFSILITLGLPHEKRGLESEESQITISNST